MKMKKENLSLDTRVANALVARITEERWPVHAQLGIPFRTENGNHMADVTVEYEDDFPFGGKLDETINRVFNLTDEKKLPQGICRICGCTDEDPCFNPIVGNCWWVDDAHTLCSHCADEAISNAPETIHCINSRLNEEALNNTIIELYKEDKQ